MPVMNAAKTRPAPIPEPMAARPNVTGVRLPSSMCCSLSVRDAAVASSSLMPLVHGAADVERREEGENVGLEDLDEELEKAHHDRDHTGQYSGCLQGGICHLKDHVL